jgi:hypothetical protein
MPDFRQEMIETMPVLEREAQEQGISIRPRVLEHLDDLDKVDQIERRRPRALRLERGAAAIRVELEENGPSESLSRMLNRFEKELAAWRSASELL